MTSKDIERYVRSVDLRLIARAVLDALRVEVLLDIFGDSTLHGDRIHSAHVFIYTSLSKAETKQKKAKTTENLLVLCQRATQLFSGSTTATLPSK